jgi:hypothetical protein
LAQEEPHGEGDLASQLPCILKIREVMESLARNTVAKACKRFWSRIEDVVDADDSFIE